MDGFIGYRLAICVLLLLFLQIIRSLYHRRQFQRFCKSRNCQRPIDLSGAFPYGLERIRRLFGSRRSGEDIMDDILGSEIKQADTFQMTMLDGSCVLTTTEPGNIQAMLATKFDDFDTGRMRHNMFWPVLGRSIFSSDGLFWEHSRGLLRPQFVRDNINDLEETERAASLFIEAIGPVDQTKWTEHVDLLPLVFNFTMGRFRL